MRNICIVGTGYVGLVTGACLADFGNQVICVDINHDKIEKLKNGLLPIYEPGLKEIVENNCKRNRLTFSTDIDNGIRDSEVIFVAVGTPAKENGEVDLTDVFRVAEKIAANLNGYKIIVNKSTVSVGTGKKVEEIIRKSSASNVNFDVVSNPEFLREGSAVGDFLRPDRIVIGTSSERARGILEEIYRPLYLIETPIISTTMETAELIKYASNAFLAVKVSFINEIANICDETGADVHVVAKAMGLDGRISPKFLHPGPGFGGSCFPKDTLALTKIAESSGLKCEIVEAAISVNRNQRLRMIQKLKRLVPQVKGKTIGILGLSFKPNTDDIREAPSLVIIDHLMTEGAVIRAYDPVANENMRRVFPSVTYCESSYETAEGCDALMLLTEWNELRELDFSRIIRQMNSPNIVDCRNIYPPEFVRGFGFNYISVGRI